jgi:thiamine biosynthesis lipoprotein
VALDLGGIAKGWLADRVAARLALYPPPHHHHPPHHPNTPPPPGLAAWEIEVADPWSDARTLALLRVREGGVATSGVIRRRWQTATGPAHHLIDPRTGAPARTDLASVTVVAPSATAAVVAAKTILLLGSEPGAAVLARWDGTGALLVSADGPVRLLGALADGGVAVEVEQ